MSSEASDAELSDGVNLMSLGADAWDDSALIDAFNQDLELYKKAHSKHQLIDLSKVSDMISFERAKKFNENALKSQFIKEDTENDDKEDDGNDEILAPSFMPFSNQNDSEPQKERINKYSSWPPAKDHGLSTNQNRKRKKKKGVESENLAKMYEEQQQKEYENKYSQAQTQSAQPTYANAYSYQQPPPMPPYQQSRQFNIGLNMMPPAPMSHNPTRDEALSNMLLCWYWNGYYAGYTAAQSRR